MLKRVMSYLQTTPISFHVKKAFAGMLSVSSLRLKFINFVFIGLLFGEQFLLILSKIVCLLLIAVFLCFFWLIETCEKVYRVQAV